MSAEASWPPPGCPPLEWPENLDGERRYEWYRAVVDAYALLWAGHVKQARIEPVVEEEIVALEQRLGTPLPESLRTYHLRLGALNLVEKLCSVGPSKTPIQPLGVAYPGIGEAGVDLGLAREMIVFGDYLGNGNLFCFPRGRGEVFYFDHDDGAPLGQLFADPEEYLEALMMRCLGKVHENDERTQELLVSRLGRPLVRKWLY